MKKKYEAFIDSVGYANAMSFFFGPKTIWLISLILKIALEKKVKNQAPAVIVNEYAKWFVIIHAIGFSIASAFCFAFQIVALGELSQKSWQWFIICYLLRNILTLLAFVPLACLHKAQKELE